MALAGKALVVDDSMMMRAHVAGVLVGEGYVVLEARDGVDALDTLRLHPDVKLVFLDMTMPRMSGVEFLKELHAVHASKPDVVVLTSGLGMALQREARDLGVRAWLTKPVSAADLSAVVRKLTPRAA